eukprot:11374682-Alexandrium_andersonii.AAC.1
MEAPLRHSSPSLPASPKSAAAKRRATRRGRRAMSLHPSARGRSVLRSPSAPGLAGLASAHQ